MTKKRILRGIILVCFLITVISFPDIRAFYNQAANGEFINNVQRNALSANIKLVQLQYETGHNSSTMSVSAGASGIIIRRDGNQYYALTAKHVIDELDGVEKTKNIVLGYEDLDFDFAKHKGMGIEKYYEQFPEAILEHSMKEYDLALISFTSEKDYAVLPLADVNPEFGDKVAAISNPYGSRNLVTAGRIGNEKRWNYEDEKGKEQYQVVKHSASISEGSSGSGLLNEDLEIVGINLGGNENLLHQFVSGMAMPVEAIRDFLKEWEE